MKGGNDERNTISSRTSVRLNISFVASAILGFGVFLYFEGETRHLSAEKEFSSLRATLATKADKAQANDRYTGAQAVEYQKSVEQRFIAAEKLNTQKYITIKGRVDSIAYDVKLLKAKE